MEIEYVAVKEFKPYSKNAKKHPLKQVEKVAASIKRFGFLQPLVVDKDNVIIVGHGRLEAAKKLGLTEVPAIRAENLTPAEVKAYRLADNRLNESEWDTDLVLEDLKELDLPLQELTGFDIKELEPQEVVEDEAPAVPEEAISKLGDLYQLGDHRLLCGDATSAEDMAKLMDGEKADMVFTDPPYGVDYEGIKNDDRKGLGGLLEGAFSNLEAFSKPGAACYCFHSDRCADIFHGVFRKFCHFSSMIIWKKSSLVLSQTDYQSIHEPCLYGWFKGTHKWHGDRKQTSVWDADAKRVEGHTTPKPIQVVVNALQNSSDSGEVVLDPFGGSGSTLIACEQTGRKCRMIELDPRYVDVIVKRWETLTSKKAVKL